jgi:glycosyltransferase involved in cell wall biosynthesis
MRIAIGVPENLESRHWNGFITIFRDIHKALSDHERIVFAPEGGDIKLEGSSCTEELVDKYRNTISLSKDFAKKVGSVEHDAVLAFTGMGLFLPEKFIYYTSNMPYKKVIQLVEGEYPDTEHFRKLLDYYRFVADKEKENYERATRIIVHSKKIEEHIAAEHGIAPGKITYIPRPIPAFSGKQEKKGNMRIILMPAELRVMKGTRYAIETMKLLKKRVPNAVLVICGRINGYEQEYMKELLREAKGKANIIVTGFLPKEHLHKYMELAECAFMPFCFDECPISLTECIGHCLPVVTNEYAGFEKETIDEFGYCAEYKNIEDYTDGIEKMLTDKSFKEKKSEGAKDVARKFDAENYKERINNVFREFAEG